MKKLIQKIKKTSLFDLILVGVILISIAFFAIVLFRKPAFVTVTVKVGEENVSFPRKGTDDWFNILFSSGMKEMDGLRRVQAEVVDVLAYNNTPTNLLPYDSLPNKKIVYLRVKLRAVYTKSSDKYTYKGKPVVVGQSITIIPDNVKVDGLITSVERDELAVNTRIKLLVEARLVGDSDKFPGTIGVMDYIASAFKVGDEVVDSKNNVLVSIVEKKVEPAKTIVTTSGGKVLLQENPLLKDVRLVLEINAVKIANKYYLFGEVPILIGQKLPLELPNVIILPIITKITPRD